MSGIQQIECPQCRLALKPARPLPGGTLVKCPRCSTQFTTPGPVPAAAPALSTPQAKPAIAATPTPAQGTMPVASFAGAPTPSAPANQSNRLVVWGIVLLGGAGLLATTACLLIALYFADRPTELAKKTDTKEIPIVQEDPKPPDSTSKPPQPPPPPNVDPRPPPDEKVTQAIDRGIAYLKKTQQANGTWGGLGVTSLAGLTLVSCDVKADDPAVQRAADYVRDNCMTFKEVHETYLVASSLLFLDKLNDPRDRERIQKLALRLVTGQLATGGWSYQCPRLSDTDNAQMLRLLQALKTKSPKELLAPPQVGQPSQVPGSLQNLAVLRNQISPPSPSNREGGDNSNTQFAILALLAAQKYDLPLDRTLSLVAQRFRISQKPSGGWSYGGTEPETVAMTCAGILGYSVGFGVSKDFSASRPLDDPQIKKALAYLGQRIGGFSASADSGPLSFPSYTLWSLERVAVLYQLKKINEKDWYGWGKDIILAKQQADGSMPTGVGDPNPVVPTCFSLLFLHRVNLVQNLTETLRSRGEPE